MKNLVGFPEVLTLVNPLTNSRWAMQIKAPMEVESTLSVDTGGKRNKNALRRKVMDYTVQCATQEAVFLSNIYVKLPGEEQPRWWDDEFRNAKMYFSVDGEDVIKGRDVIQHMVVDKDQEPNGCTFELSDSSCLFQAITPYGNKGRHDDRGLFCPNGAILQAQIVGIPTGIGKVKIKAGCIATVYEYKG